MAHKAKMPGENDTVDGEPINIALEDIYDYGRFRRNPGPIMQRASTQRRPLLVIKGRQRVVVINASAYEDLVLRAGRNDSLLTSTPERTGTEG